MILFLDTTFDLKSHVPLFSDDLLGNSVCLAYLQGLLSRFAFFFWLAAKKNEAVHAVAAEAGNKAVLLSTLHCMFLAANDLPCVVSIQKMYTPRMWPSMATITSFIFWLCVCPRS